MAKDAFFTLDVDISQFEIYQEVLEGAKVKFKDFERLYITALANEIIKKAIPITPVDTGRLRRSYKVSKIQEKGDSLEITVYNDARDNGASESYASYVELGHFTRNRVKWIEGRFMLTVSTDEVRNEMNRVFDILFDKWVKENGL